MKFETGELSESSDFSLPLAVRPDLLWARGDEPFFSLVFVESGRLSARTESGIVVSSPGASVLLMRPGHGIAELSHEGGEAWGLVFRPESLNYSLSALNDSSELPDAPEFFFFKPYRDLPPPGFALRSVSFALAHKLSMLFRNLNFHLNVEQGEFWPCMARSFMLETLILVERVRYAESGNSSVSVTETDGPMGKVYEYLRVSCAESLTLNRIAARFATNRTDLNAEFRKAYGVTVMQCLASMRMEIAASMLRNTELAVFEIAGRNGFPNEAYFARCFKKKNGVTPSDYRKSFPSSYG